MALTDRQQTMKQSQDAIVAGKGQKRRLEMRQFSQTREDFAKVKAALKAVRIYRSNLLTETKQMVSAMRCQLWEELRFTFSCIEDRWTDGKPWRVNFDAPADARLINDGPLIDSEKMLGLMNEGMTSPYHAAVASIIKEV